MQERGGPLERSGWLGRTLSPSTLQAREAGRTLSRAAETQPFWLRLRRVRGFNICSAAQAGPCLSTSITQNKESCMGYYMRFITTDSRPSSIADLRTALKAAHPAWDLNETSGGTRLSATISFEGALYGDLEINHPGDGLFEDELQELKEFLEYAGKGSKRKVTQTLSKATAIYAVQVLWQGRDTEETLDKLQIFWDHLFARHAGLLQADGEGYYDDNGIVLAVE